jgi:non-structural maintenance of chromosomes element 4
MSLFGQMSEAQEGERLSLKAFNWFKFGSIASASFKTAPCAQLDCMLGAVSPPKPKVKAARADRSRKKREVGPAMRPDQMDTNKQDDSNETSRLTEAMYETVVQHEGRPYAHFVLDPHSFAQTVENMFSIAILVGNAKVALIADEEWGMVVCRPRGDGAPGGGRSQVKGESAQMVLNMNFVTWRAMVDVVRAEDCLTPHRSDIRLAYALNDGAGAGKRSRRI